MQRKSKTQRKKENAARRGLTNGTSHGGEVANETNYRREKKEKREGGVAGLNKNSIGRMCCNEEEINRKEEAEMKREDVGTKDESCWGVVIHTLVSF